MVLQGQSFVVGRRYARAVVGDLDEIDTELLELNLDVFRSGVLVWKNVRREGHRRGG